MGNRVRTGFVGNLNQTTGDERACDGSPQQVLPFVDGVGAEHREHVVTNEFLAQVLNVDFLHAQRFRFLTRWLHFLALANIGGERHHLTLIGILQPANDYRGIQATGIRQNHLFNIRHALAPD